MKQTSIYTLFFVVLLLVTAEAARAEVHTVGVVDAVPGLNIIASGVSALFGGGEEDEDPAGRAYASPKGSLFTDANLYAGDVLRAQLAGRLHAGSAIAAASFVNLDDLEDAGPLGRLSSSQVGARLAQYGHTVLEARLRAGIGYRRHGGEFLLTRDAARLLQQELMAEAALVGSYQVTDSLIYMSVRVARLDDGAVLAAYEYHMPNQGMVRELAMPGMINGVWERHATRPRLFSAAFDATPELQPLQRTPGPTRVQPSVSQPSAKRESRFPAEAADMSGGQNFPALSEPPRRSGPPFSRVH